jgi:hypothetical protein
MKESYSEPAFLTGFRQEDELGLLGTQSPVVR